MLKIAVNYCNNFKLSYYISLILSLILFSGVISFTSCKKEEVRKMLVSNDSISDISYTTARANATIIDPGEGIEQHGHCWATSTEPTIHDNDNKTDNGTASTSGTYNSIMSGLLPGTRYYVRAYTQNSTTVVYGEEILSFYTLSIGAPVVTTGEVKNITKSSATIGGNLENPGPGATEVSQHGHCWSSETITPVIDNNENKTSLGSKNTTGAFESELVGLLPSTLYYVRAYATNSAGTSYGDQASFTTEAEVPTVTTANISSITYSSAQGGGNVTSDGGASVTVRGVCWSTSENPTISDNHTNDGSGTGEFTSNITGLSPLTTYYVRAYATNSAGTAYGNSVSFETLTDDPNVDWEPGDDWTDRRDNQKYKTVQIGDQVWMAENMKATVYADSTPLVDGTGVGDITNDYTTKYWFFYNDNPGNKETYGLLYTWAAMMNGEPAGDNNPSGVQGICPTGWHVSSDSEWKEMEMFLGMNQAEADATDWRGIDEGTELKTTVGWNSGGNGTNLSGFSALPAGFRHWDGNFGSLGVGALFWTCTEFDSQNVWGRLLLFNYENVFRNYDYKDRGLSVRCVKD
ncbi:MAG: hypothetical protein JSV22_09890 [Bacteroidales bacterium]|nr:MAG: hypothetical protein JSV22_09890 [Bacteroidales bacterium]